ncbi:anthranilate synthase, component II [Desulforamulus reducens MI-1]|uniref:Anthranilate synthase, component II n=1 Tax=Desulforamulus reducens (strain ATCC BAA-1160 / DSM 100696 / MI-1) TaxID=349161 RepID=A4J145_DESRM|nr:aminodeoxychorismate/anthranilate synthase component II [Desulforamulus reducens]ABO48798.1 anthranilate synthase, component II [Desulforamulus reducens MI-1]
MLAVLDNYDSFTYNLVQLVRELGQEVRVYRNDAVSLKELLSPEIKGLIISPGPGRPEQAGICQEAVRYLVGKLPILGVCLGHQVIAQSLGGRVVPAARLMHGKTSAICHDNRGLYSNIPQQFVAARYHSLAVEEKSLPTCLKVTARTKEGEVMGIRHQHYPVEGVQFHPESIATTCGKDLLSNFINQSS